MLLYNTCTTAQETEFYHYNTRWHWTSQWVKSAKSRRHDKIAIRSTKLVSEPERCSAQFCMWQNTGKLARRTDTAFCHLLALLLQALMTQKIRTHGNDCLHHSFEVEGVETLNCWQFTGELAAFCHCFLSHFYLCTTSLLCLSKHWPLRLK